MAHPFFIAGDKMDSIEWAWPKGSMEFRIKDMESKRATIFRSKLRESPSEFISRVIKSCRRWSGIGVRNYLISELKNMTDDEVLGK